MAEEKETQDPNNQYLVQFVFVIVTIVAFAIFGDWSTFTDPDYCECQEIILAENDTEGYEKCIELYYTHDNIYTKCERDQLLGY
jgi:hypothetical protein